MINKLIKNDTGMCPPMPLDAYYRMMAQPLNPSGSVNGVVRAQKFFMKMFGAELFAKYCSPLKDNMA